MEVKMPPAGRGAPGSARSLGLSGAAPRRPLPCSLARHSRSGQKRRETGCQTAGRLRCVLGAAAPSVPRQSEQSLERGPMRRGVSGTATVLAETQRCV